MFVSIKIAVFAFILSISASLVLAQSGWTSTRVESPGDLIAVFFTSSERGFIAGDDGYLGVTRDGGRTWTREPLNVKGNITEIYFRNDDNGYLVAGKDMFITKDGGRSWQKTLIVKTSDFRGTTPEFLSIRFANKKLGFAIGSVLKVYKDDDVRVIDSLVMRTNNGGEDWSRVILPTKAELFHMDFVNDERGWIVGADGLILTTDDSGLNWTIQKSHTTKDLYNIFFRDSKNGFAVGEGGTVLRTENGGENWEIIKTAFPKTFLRVDFADEKNGWIVGKDGIILRSSDKGRTWIKQESNTKEDLYGLFMTKKYGWAVGANGTVIEYQR